MCARCDRGLDLDSGYLSRVLRARWKPRAWSRSVRVQAIDASARRTSREPAAVNARDSTRAATRSPRRSSSRSTTGSESASSRRCGTCERLLTAPLVEIGPTDPEAADARFCLDAYFAELGTRFDRGFDPARSISADDDELRPPAGVLLVARLRSEPIGCGALKFHRRAPTEIKRMWVAPSARGLGVGRKLLAALEQRGREHGRRTVRLETNRALTEAIAMYRSAGYVEVDAFNDEPYAHHWFEKRLGRASAGSSAATFSA